jgi:hypothetical protein
MDENNDKSTDLPNKSENKSENNQVAITTPKYLQSLVQFRNLNDANEFFKILAQSERFTTTNPADIIAMYVQAQELGIGFASASNHMHIVNGKAGIDIQIVKALISKPGTGITWEHTEDYIPIYKYTDKTTEYFSDNIPTHCMICYNADDIKKAKDDGKTAIFPYRLDNQKWNIVSGIITPIDRRSTYLFSRLKLLPNGQWFTQKEIGTFSWSDASTAGILYDKNNEINPKSAWHKYPRNQLNVRAFTFGARAIGADLLMGMYETSELHEFAGEQNHKDEVTIIKP